MTTTRSSTARETARQLLARETVGAGDPAAIAAALQRVCTRVSENLRHSVGNDGYNALLSRVVSRTGAAHPVLMDILRVDDAGIHLCDVVATADKHGVPAASAALEALLAALVEVLSSLIGADMVLNILDTNTPSPRTPIGAQTS